MKNFIKSTTKSIYLWVIFSCSVLFTVYAANITGVTNQTISSGDTIGNGWFQDVNDSIVPTWAVMAFNLSSCPAGWSEYTAARGRTVIWAGSWAGSNTIVGATGWEKSAPAIDVKLQVSTSPANVYEPRYNESIWKYPYISKTDDFTNIFFNSTFWEPELSELRWIVVTWAGTAPDNMQPYVSLLYCQKS